MSRAVGELVPSAGGSRRLQPGSNGPNHSRSYAAAHGNRGNVNHSSGRAVHARSSEGGPRASTSAGGAGNIRDGRDREQQQWLDRMGARVACAEPAPQPAASARSRHGHRVTSRVSVVRISIPDGLARAADAW